MTDQWVNAVHEGDAFDVLDELPAESVHAIVTDPPYGLAFMGRGWDTFDPLEYQRWCERWATLALDVLKPGGHILAFSGNRTHHRLFSGVEDAGFEVRDTLTWHYGSGFPKALDVSKAIDKAAGVEREVVGERQKMAASGEIYGHYEDGVQPVTAPATDAAREWDGWKTSLKPATEFIVLARKPFSGTVAENVQAHGTGALNIDGCRIDMDGETKPTFDRTDRGDDRTSYDLGGSEQAGTTTEGRYPANVVLDAEVAERLDREVGETESSPVGFDRAVSTDGSNEGWQADAHEGDGYQSPGDRVESNYDDRGGPSRYFYTSKATRAERTLDGRIENAHPTVKPVDLMEWLVRLVTAEGQTVLDPFCGTGTTLRAAKNLGRHFVGIERQSKWADLARVRCGLTPTDPATVRSDAQAGLERWVE